MIQNTCPECGYVNTTISNYCDECGCKLPEPKKEPEPVQELTPLAKESDPIEEVLVAKESEPVEETLPKKKKFSSETILDFEPEYPTSKPKKFSAPTVLEEPEEPIVVLIHTETGTRFELPSEEKTIYIGKDNEEITIHVEVSDLPNADIVSRIQAVIFKEENNEFYLEDAGSLNGTQLNGEELKAGVRHRKLIKDGDKISFGKNRKVDLTFNIIIEE